MTFSRTVYVSNMHRLTCAALAVLVERCALSYDYGCNKCTLYCTGPFTRSTPEAVKRVRVWGGVMNNGLGTDRSARIVYCLMAGTVPIVLGGGLEDIEVHHFPRAHLQNAGRVSTSVAVIRG